MVPRTVLTKSGPISINTATLVNIVQPRTVVNNAGPMKNVINNAYSTARRHFNKITAANNSNFTKKVNTVKGTRVNTARPKVVLSVVQVIQGNAFKEASTNRFWRPKHKFLDHVSRNNGASMCGMGNPQQDLKDKGVIDSGCSRHMTGNRSYLIDYEEIDGGFVAFGGNSKGGKITGKVFKEPTPPGSDSDEADDGCGGGAAGADIYNSDLTDFDGFEFQQGDQVTMLHVDELGVDMEDVRGVRIVLLEGWESVCVD
ncbi:hypothetical protein Tco_1146690 [Tanacetum coccineum]